MNFQTQTCLNSYTSYLIASTNQVTSTGLSRLLEGELSHDQITRFLGKEELSQKEFWSLIKGYYKDVKQDDGILIVDDTVEEKPHSSVSETINYWYDHVVGRTVKGLNILSCHYDTPKGNSPIGFRIMTKEQHLSSTTTEKQWKMTTSKIKAYKELLQQAVKNGVQFHTVINDKWYASVETMDFIVNTLQKEFIMPLKENRCIALSKEDFDKSHFRKLQDCKLEDVTEVYLKGWDRPVLLTQLSIKDGTDCAVTLYLVSSNLRRSKESILKHYKRRWKVEEAFKSMKSNLNLQKSPTHSKTAIHNHIFCVFLATVELYFIAHYQKTNPFALKLNIYYKALKIAFNTTTQLRNELKLTA